MTDNRPTLERAKTYFYPGQSVFMTQRVVTKILDYGLALSDEVKRLEALLAEKDKKNTCKVHDEGKFDSYCTCSPLEK